MPSAYPLPSHSIQSPLRSDLPIIISNICSNKFPGSKLVLVPTNFQGANLSSYRDYRLCAKVASLGIDSFRAQSCLFEKDNSLAVEEDERKSLANDKRTSALQVQNLLDEIRGALPYKTGMDVLKVGEFKEGGDCSISDFNDLLMDLAVADRHDLVLKLCSNLSSYGLVADSWTHSIVIRCHCKKNNVDEAKGVLDHMLENGFKPNVATFTTLINSLCKRGKLKKAFEVFEAMDRIWCRPTVQTYNCLLKGLCYVGRVEEAFELLADIKKKKASIEPDIYTYTALMNGFCKVGRSDEAVELLNEALEMGLTPNVVTYNTLFNGYCKEGRPLMGVSVLKQMRQRNCLPDYIGYSTLLHGLLLWGKIQEAMEVYKEMIGSGFIVDERLTNGLVRGLCRQSFVQNDMLEDAYEVFEQMKERAFVINQSTYVSVIEALCMAGKVDDVMVNLHEMIGLGYIPRVITVNRVIRALCVEGHIDKAILVLVLMYENRKMLSRISYDLLISELNRQKMFLGACNIYGAALVRGVLPRKRPGRRVKALTGCPCLNHMTKA